MRGWASWCAASPRCAAVEQHCSANPTNSCADYTKSVIDLRPEEFVGESSSMGDRSKSVPGLTTELVRPLVVLELAVPVLPHTPHVSCFSLIAG